MILIVEPEASAVFESDTDIFPKWMVELLALAARQDISDVVAHPARTVLWSTEERR
ncbi:hypothetical protein [Streptomyces shenzhenensis]|uniref:hypothetical protein n=1 Tax=Streptomyces shenzhenensis TaxID=943815 RepID=UPI0033CF06AA